MTPWPENPRSTTERSPCFSIYSLLDYSSSSSPLLLSDLIFLFLFWVRQTTSSSSLIHSNTLSFFFLLILLLTFSYLLSLLCLILLSHLSYILYIVVVFIFLRIWFWFSNTRNARGRWYIFCVSFVNLWDKRIQIRLLNPIFDNPRIWMWIKKLF